MVRGAIGVACVEDAAEDACASCGKQFVAFLRNVEEIIVVDRLACGMWGALHVRLDGYSGRMLGMAGSSVKQSKIRTAASRNVLCVARGTIQHVRYVTVVETLRR